MADPAAPLAARPARPAASLAARPAVSAADLVRSSTWAARHRVLGAEHHEPGDHHEQPGTRQDQHGEPAEDERGPYDGDHDDFDERTAKRTTATKRESEDVAMLLRSYRGRHASGPAEHPVDGDLDRHPVVALARLPVALGVAAHRLGDPAGSSVTVGRALEGEPPAAVDLAHRGPAARARARAETRRLRAFRDGAKVMTRASPALGVPGEADRHDVRRAVGPQRGERGEVALGEERGSSGARARRGPRYGQSWAMASSTLQPGRPA